MAAPAPITNETPAWDVLDPFPKSHARARQTKSGNPLSKSLTYSYDAVGNRRSLDAPDSGRFSYVYDAADQLSSVLNPFSELTTFSHDIAGRRTVQRYSNGTRASIIYDTANNVTQFHNRTSTGTAITTNDYKYDNVGNRTGMLEASGDRLTWTYDNGDQLKSERRSGASGYANTFTYDGVGNRTLKNAGATRTTFSYDVADQLVYSQAVAGRTSYVYDNAGNQQIERPPTGSRTTTVWDNENRPTLYRLPDTSLVTMSYNGNNRRVTKQTATETVKFVWDPAADAYLAEFNGSNVLQATYSQEPVQFGRALSQRRSTTSSWYHTDALGSTQALSNSSRVTSDTYLYDAWGNPITSTGTTVNPFRWVGNVGYYFDFDTGLYYIRARTYQPTIARWTSADPLFYMLAKAGAWGAFTKNPIGFNGSEWNLHEFVSSRPLALVDPSGESVYEIGLQSKITNKRCTGCGDAFWTVTHAKDPSSIPPNGKPRVVGYIVQKVCNEKVRTFCEWMPCGSCKEGTTQRCKACAYEIIGAILAGNGKIQLFPEVEDTWKNKGSDDQDCISKGAGIISADIRVLSPHADLKNWADGINKGGNQVIIDDGCGGKGVGFAPNSRKLSDPPPPGWDKPLSKNSAAAWQRWNCCPKPVGSPATSCDSFETGWKNTISGVD